MVNRHWLILVLAVPFFGLPSPWPLVSIFVVTLVWVGIWLTGTKPLAKTPLNVPILILSIMILVSTLVTYDLRISIGFVAGAVLGLVAYFTVIRYSRTSKGWWICFFLFVVSNLFLTTAVSLMVEWPQKIDLLTPVTSLLKGPLIIFSFFPRIPSPNIIPVFLLAVLPLLFIFTLYALGQRKNWSRIYGPMRTTAGIIFLLVFTLIGGFILLLSESRGGYIAFLATVLIMLMVGMTNRGRWLLLIGLAITSLIIIVQLGNGNLASVQEKFQETLAVDSGMSQASLYKRFDIWSRALYGVQDFPLTGMGMGTFGYIMPVLYPIFGIRVDGIPTNAHNTYLQAALDLGLPGLIALLWVQVASLWMLFKSWRMVNKWQDDPVLNQDHPMILGSRVLVKPVLLGLGGVYGAYLLFGMIESFSLGVYILNWMLTGLIVAFYLKARNMQDGEDSAFAWHGTVRGDEQNLKGSPAVEE